MRVQVNRLRSAWLWKPRLDRSWWMTAAFQGEKLSLYWGVWSLALLYNTRRLP